MSDAHDRLTEPEDRVILQVRIAGEPGFIHEYDDTVQNRSPRENRIAAAEAAGHGPSIAVVLAAINEAIIDSMTGNIGKHQPFSWAERTDDEDIDKAIRHLMTWRLMRNGYTPVDAEGLDAHLINALTRLAMVAAKPKVPNVEGR